MRNQTLLQSFMSKISICENGCWHWMASGQRGQLWVPVRKRSEKPARVSLHLFKEFDLDSSLLACHKDDICNDEKCVNPDYLYAGTNSQNQRDAYRKGKISSNSLKTHCPKGHAYTKENTLLSQGRRNCRTCRGQKCMQVIK